MPAQLRAPLHSLAHWLVAHPWALVSFAFGVLMLVASAVAAYVALRRLPADYFVREHHRHRPRWVRVARTIAGAVAIVAGIAMLVLPGQGVLSILLGLALLDVPAKHRAIHWILEQPRVGDGLNALRRRLHAPPFVMPHHTHA